jgi:DNA-binding GntR family transcriptional regulator
MAVAMKKAAKRENQTLERVTVADAVTERLRHLILSGEIPHGAALRQDALAEEMGTSRIPVREALSRLESEGLAASFPHRGYVVTPMTRDEIIELYDLRALLEPELIRQAIPKMTLADLDAAAAVMHQFEGALQQGDMNSWGELNRRYHLVLYQPSGRPRTLEIVRGLLVNTDRYTRVLLLGAGGPALSRAKEEHGALLDLCRKGAVNQAVALTRDHVQRNCEELLETLGQETSWP